MREDPNESEERRSRPYQVLFLHGREGNPQGSKANWLRDYFKSIIPPLDTSSIEAAREDALNALARAEGAVDLLVGSSFGGALAMDLVSGGHWDGPVVLLAPAVALVPDLQFQPTQPCVVVQGRRDGEVVCEDVMKRFTGEDSEIFVIQGPWEHRLKGAREDGTIRRAIQWALGEDPLSSSEKSHGRQRRPETWPEVSPPETLRAFLADLGRVSSMSPQHPQGRLMRAIAGGDGLSADQPITGAGVVETHRVFEAVDWVFHGNRTRTGAGVFHNRLYLSPRGESSPSLVLFATFPDPRPPTEAPDVS